VGVSKNGQDLGPGRVAAAIIAPEKEKNPFRGFRTSESRDEWEEKKFRRVSGLPDKTARMNKVCSI